MKNVIGTGSALDRLKRIIPASVQPKFSTADEWRAWQEAEGRKRSEELDRMNQKSRTEKIFGRSGIQDLHQQNYSYRIQGVTMKNVIGTGSALDRLKRIIPASVQPKFSTADEWRAWQEAEGRKRSEELDRMNQKSRTEKIFGRSGIQDLHRSCTFANYEVSGEGQRKAYTMAKSYAQNFGSGFASFVFSGGPGTGKNHLAAAIGNHLLAGGHSVLVVTIPDLMLRVRECYDGGQSEASLLDDLCKVDLLVLDEVGIQRGSSGEKVILNQVIDRRLSSMRPVGVLTNLNHEGLLDSLGARVIDRLQMDGGMWVNFDWGSYRKNVSHLRIVK